ncbi:hypothetical protein PsorP6_015238 [Peronosclerospora sorghi]|uniref:Uncharacterized protein n=1 Tax=Peronosclerospora sorghi TaxID=230839 RepID=A0ACC0VU35_9STRA|nr:hypothetical protein PsorP6_015238 [Peronosclerospora sorghi]
MLRANSGFRTQSFIAAINSAGGKKPTRRRIEHFPSGFSICQYLLVCKVWDSSHDSVESEQLLGWRRVGRAERSDGDHTLWMVKTHAPDLKKDGIGSGTLASSSSAPKSLYSKRRVESHGKTWSRGSDRNVVKSAALLLLCRIEDQPFGTPAIAAGVALHLATPGHMQWVVSRAMEIQWNFPQIEVLSAPQGHLVKFVGKLKNRAPLSLCCHLKQDIVGMFDFILQRTVICLRSARSSSAVSQSCTTKQGLCRNFAIDGIYRRLILFGVAASPHKHFIQFALTHVLAKALTHACKIALGNEAFSFFVKVM